MKKFCILCACLALSGFVSCQKQQTEEERKAEIDRQVEQRLAAERQTDEQQKLAQREAELNAREKTLSEQQAVATTPAPQRRPANTRQVRDESEGAGGSYNTFYTKLEPYGDWRESSEYGYVWQPREAEGSRTWRPYTSGRWVYTDVGWTWVSEERFGWATYHYGRWTRLRNIGWVWVPGDEWAPAWVSWRKSNDYVGWAPLPPEARFDRRKGIHNWSDNYYDIGPDQYSFVPTTEFGAQRVERTVVPREQNVTIINQTTNVTNITYNNTTVVNQGPNYDELRTRTRQPIERLRLQREVNVDLSTGEPSSVVRGEVVVIPAPLITRAQSVERPQRVKETVAAVQVDRGWEAITDRSASEKTRAKMKSEATPPSDAPSKTFSKQTEPETSVASAASAAPSTSVAPTATTTAKPAVVQTPAATGTPAAPSPRPTSASSATPALRAAEAVTTATAKPLTAQTPSPTGTRSITTPPPLHRATSTPTPSATGTVAGRSVPPALIVPGRSPSSSVAPAVPAEAEERQKAQRELRKQWAPAKAQRQEDTLKKPKVEPMPVEKNSSEAPSPSATASVAASEGRKEEGRNRNGKVPPNQSKVSPTPTPTPGPE
jgi:uncharacterized protein DUF6600